MHSVGAPLYWTIFFIVVVAMLALDLGAFQEPGGKLSKTEVLGRLFAWILAAAAFDAGIYYFISKQHALEFAAGYMLEESLSVDNIFVIILVFRAFKIGHDEQHRVLFWGIIGAALLRATLILAGTAAIQRFAWLNAAFGVFLLFSAIKILFDGAQHSSADGRIVRAVKRFVPTAQDPSGKQFFVPHGAGLAPTPLFVVLVVVELTDVVFALDSIPAVFGVTTDPFIVFTSNIFAIVGLRTLFFFVSGMVEAFRFLPYGVALVLAFIGTKMCASHWFTMPVGISLVVIGALLAAAVFLSLALPQRKEPA